MARSALAAVLAGVLSMTANGARSAEVWTRYGKEQGLPDDAVRSLCLDGKRRLWAGTLGGGLAVFDGARFAAYEPALLGTPHVRHLALGQHGEIWAATDAGAARIAEGKPDWMKAGTPGLLSADLLRVFPDVAGKTWLVPLHSSYSEAEGVSTWDGQKLTVLSPPEGTRLGTVLAVVHTSAVRKQPALSNTTLVVSEKGLFKAEGSRLEAVPLEGTPLWRPTPRGRNEEEESRRLPPVYLLAACQTRDGTIWFLHPQAVIALDSTGFREVVTAPRGRFGPWLAASSDGTLWAAGFDGPLMNMDVKGLQQSVELPLQKGEAVDQLYVGSSSGVWIATRGLPGNLLRAFPTARVEGVLVERIAGIGGEHEPISVNALLEPPDGGLWLGSDNGLFRLPVR
jgi:two component regulator with propeller domain